MLCLIVEQGRLEQHETKYNHHMAEAAPHRPGDWQNIREELLMTIWRMQARIAQSVSSLCLLMSSCWIQWESRKDDFSSSRASEVKSLVSRYCGVVRPTARRARRKPLARIIQSCCGARPGPRSAHGEYVWAAAHLTVTAHTIPTHNTEIDPTKNQTTNRPTQQPNN